MKYLMWLLWLFIPREGEGDGGTGGNQGGGGDSGAGNMDAGTGDDGQKKPLSKDPEGRPDWLAEKFWDADMKKPRTEVMGKAYNELEGKVRETRDTIKGEVIAEMKAAAPESYEVNLSKDLNIPENVEMDLTAEDPLVKWFFGFAKEHGMSQEIVDGAINEYIGIELAALPDVGKEIEKLGDHGQDRMMRVHNWMENKLSDAQFQSMNSLLSRADQVEALETLMKSSGPSNFDGGTGGAGLTRDELKVMQDDPRYHRDKDPVFISKVTAGYARLAKGK